jgi:CDP-ribitol ribitolphosphotransferase
MREYAAAGYVYICSYFLPVSSCVKRPETKVIQLWHSGGLLKKMGHDTTDDIPEYYKGNVTANYDLVTVSAPVCVPVWESALKLPEGITKPLGLPRTDIYYNEKWNSKCRDAFYKLYPDAEGKRIALYAPSFSGNAADPKCAGLDMNIQTVFEELDDWYLIVRPHPHMKKKYPEYFDERTNKLSTEKLLPVADLLITDYSSILFDYSIYRKPFVLFCPDIDEYIRDRGFYADPYSFPCELTKTKDELLKAVINIKDNKNELEEFFQKYMSACDGHATRRIIQVAEEQLESE